MAIPKRGEEVAEPQETKVTVRRNFATFVDGERLDAKVGDIISGLSDAMIELLKEKGLVE